MIVFDIPSPEPELPPDTIIDAGPLSISNTMLACWLGIIVVVSISFMATRKMTVVPGRFQTMIEAGVEGLLGFVESIAGREHGRKFFPIVATIFVFVIANAYIGLLPFMGHAIYGIEESSVVADMSGIVTSVEVIEGDEVDEGEVICYLDSGAEISSPTKGKIEHLSVEVGQEVGDDSSVASIEREFPFLRAANTDVNVTLALALISFVCVEFWGLTAVGVNHYMRRFFNFGQLFQGVGFLLRGRIGSGLGALFGGIIDAFVGMLELLSEFIRIISFTFRLFGNMTAGEILLATILSLIPLVAILPFYGLELLVGFVQALIFAGLTLVFATMAITTHDADEE
ncbi:MAG: F0F1 ATP synthase subunit A [Chloroflexota bacterium]|nr:F0F1 ATP synthase subunit A [Chloroflexota bacterium]